MLPLRRGLRGSLARWARRRQGLDVLPLRLTRRRLYILPTRAGWSFAVLVLGMLFGGLNYGNSLALLLCFALAGFGLVAMMRCHARLLGVEVRSLQVGRSFAGDPVPMDVTLRVPPVTAVGDLLLRLSPERSRPRAAAAPAAVAAEVQDEGEHSLARMRLLAPPAARGPWPVPRLRLATRAPFALFEAWTWLHLGEVGLVWPAPRGELPLPVAPGRAGGLAPRLAGHDEWAGLRPFRDADSPRQVAWKAYARGAPLLVREYHDPAGEERRLRWTDLPTLDTEARLSQLARWVLRSAGTGERWALELPGVVLGPDGGEAHRQRCLDALARHGTGSGA